MLTAITTFLSKNIQKLLFFKMSGLILHFGCNFHCQPNTLSFEKKFSLKIFKKSICLGGASKCQFVDRGKCTPEIRMLVFVVCTGVVSHKICKIKLHQGRSPIMGITSLLWNGIHFHNIYRYFKYYNW